jgi:hypothetical protein
MYSKDAYSRNTSCELKAVDKDRFRDNPVYVQLARQAAADADNASLPMELRLDCKEELERLMDRLCGTTWRAGEQPDDGRSEIDFWLDQWDRMKEYAPDMPIFQKYTREDLMDEILADSDELDDLDDIEHIAVLGEN